MKCPFVLSAAQLGADRWRLHLAGPTLVALFSLACGALAPPVARADVKLPSIFTEHLVLQRDLADPVWGSADPGEEVTVTIADQKHTTKADDSGKWRVKLSPLPAGGPHHLTVQGKNKIELTDVLVGEVWICSGQSNMQWNIGSTKDSDLEIKAANFPQIRFVNVPQVGTQEPQSDFKGAWQVCSPQTVNSLTAVGYFFGRQIFETINVPVGLINDAWGGSACEAWIRRDILAADSQYGPLMQRWEEIEKAATPDPKQLTGNSRPGNIYNGVLKPTIGYGIRGAIWYQGETNAGRAYQYRNLFPLMIKSWRDEWAQGDFPFYWVQLADYQPEKPEPGDSAWAELREAQTMTMDKLPNAGQAVIIDIGEGKDIHPRNKQDVGHRLARWALARDYGVQVAYHSPQYKSMERKENKIVLTFDHLGGGFRLFDVKEPRGFTIAGEDKKFYNAQAKLDEKTNQIEVWANEVSEPVAVRYAWADNPVCNVFSKEDLPLTPFRTDDWPGVTVNNVK
jgi:sialate O-acetylesterase